MTRGLFVVLGWWRRQHLLHVWLILLGVQYALQWYLADGTLVSSLLAPSRAAPFLALTVAAAFVMSRFLALAVLPALVLAELFWQVPTLLSRGAGRRRLTSPEQEPGCR